jgi:hypothetical protein
MGLDFIKKAAPSFKKGIDRSRIALGTPGLFTKQPIEGARCYSAKLHVGMSAAVGDEVGVRLIDREVILLRGLTQLARLTNPPERLWQALVASFGEASGRVEETLEISRTIEVSIC